MLRYLASKGADVNLACRQGVTPLLLAVIHNRLQVARHLVRHGADLHPEIQGNTALQIAVRLGDRRNFVRLLTDVGSAGGWANYAAARRLPYCLIRHRVGETFATLRLGDPDRELYHFLFGRTNFDVPVAEGEQRMLVLPDDLFSIVVGFLGELFPRGRSSWTR